MKAGAKETLLVTGGCRSGKSRFARQWAEAYPPTRLFLATAQVLDAEMVDRVRRHQAARGAGWETVEEPLAVGRVVREQGAGASVILLDCVTLWVSNLLLAGSTDEEILAKVGELEAVLGAAPCPAALVTNEVGWGIVPDHPLGRRFRDLAGAVNQRLAQIATRVVLMVAGLPVSVK